MKSLIKIYSKYIGMAFLISTLFFITNIILFFFLSLYRYNIEQEKGYFGYVRMQNFAEITLEENEEGKFEITEEGIKYMKEKGLAFLLVLNEAGDVMAQWNQPEGFKQHYTAGDIAAFSKWYLEGYPVGVWRIDGGLLVLGYQKDSLWKYNIEFPEDFIRQIFLYLKVGLGVNILLILALVVFCGYRYYLSMKPMTEGLELLAVNKRVYLPEKGVTSELTRQINKASEILERQRKTLQARDYARTEWIAGISHDIRTPLSIIMGYADELECNKNIAEEDRKKAETIRMQSVQIKQLIEDLNLTSKLAYQMQPLKIEIFYPAEVIRNLIVDRMNEGLEEKYQLLPKIETSVEECCIEADKGLLTRAVKNLMNNSIQHNPNGCDIQIEVCTDKMGISIIISDNGCGIPAEIIGMLMKDEVCMHNEQPDTQEALNKKKPHIMGLRIAKQITLAHKGIFTIDEHGHNVTIWLPLKFTAEGTGNCGG